MSSRWIRLDTTWSKSQWVAELSSSARLAWIELLCYMKAHGNAGSVKSLCATVAAREWGVTVEEFAQMMEAAIKDGAVVVDGGDWILTGWHRQTDTTNAKRQAAYRDRQRVTLVTDEVTVVTPTETVSVTSSSSKETDTDDLAFGEFWEAYPKRAGGNPKSTALSRWRTNRKNGVSAGEMISGAERYAVFVGSNGNVGTEFVQQAATFLGGREGWKETWETAHVVTDAQRAEKFSDDMDAEMESQMREAGVIQ